MPSFTRRAIMESFLKLLDARPLNKITIKDIVEDCGINRNTFYYHFEDIPALVEAIVQDTTDQLMQRNASVPSLEAGVYAAVEEILRFRRAILHIYNSPNREMYERSLMQQCQYIVETFLTAFIGERRISAEDRAIVAQLYKCQCYGMFIDWLNDDLRGDLQPRIERLAHLRRGMLDETIARCDKEA